MTTYPNCVMKFVKIEPQAMKSNSYRNNYIQYSMLYFLLSLHDFAILHISFEYNEKHKVTMSSQAGEHHFMAHGTPYFPIPPSPQCCISQQRFIEPKTAQNQNKPLTVCKILCNVLSEVLSDPCCNHHQNYKASSPINYDPDLGLLADAQKYIEEGSLQLPSNLIKSPKVDCFCDH